MGDGCVANQRNLFIEGHCENRADVRDQTLAGSRVFFTDRDDRRVCQALYSDQTCTGAQSFGVQANCESVAVLGECASSNRWTVYKDFCIASSTPEPPFVIPIVQRRVYGSEGACVSGDSRAFAESLSPNDPTFCASGNYAQQNLIMPRMGGSVQGFCKGNAYVSTLFSDFSCSEQSSNMFITSANIGDCQGPPNPELGLPDALRYATSCAEAPLYHCMNFTEAGIGQAFPNKKLSPSPSASHVGTEVPVPSASPTEGAASDSHVGFPSSLFLGTTIGACLLMLLVFS